MPAPPSSRASPLPALAAEALACLRFFTRFGFPELAVETRHPPAPFARALRWAPAVGGLIGLCGAAILALADRLGFPPLVDATAALLATVLVGGGLHEDGLADVADGFGGGVTPERKLEIMRDSRLGTYGALALGFSLMSRAACLAALVERGGTPLAVAGLVAANAASRGFGLLPMASLRPARRDGLGHGAGRLPRGVFPTACGLALGIGLAVPAALGAGLTRPLFGLGLAALAAVLTTRLARRQIGGFTGDVVGACQQFCEIAVLLGLLAGSRPG